ncbi:chaperone modulator CbpM [Rhizobium sp. 18055]|uniref:chaperone modulator CbpM n=1 Tax=Rhizobium sp. 18055 TaxID=2681403 RepID=UPI001359A321|nr:chaperone modulator CbpM [Rhizobium sp. 18055]
MNDVELREILSIEVTVLEFWIEQSWIVPDMTGGEPSFRDADVARGQLILDLLDRMGVNEAGVDVIMELIDQLHGMRETMQDLVRAVRSQDEDTQMKIFRQTSARQIG